MAKSYTGTYSPDNRSGEADVTFLVQAGGNVSIEVLHDDTDVANPVWCPVETINESTLRTVDFRSLPLRFVCTQASVTVH